MARLVFHLSNVPDEEADLVRQALTDAEIEFFETQAGRWRIGVAGIWVHTDDDVPLARSVIDAVQDDLPKTSAMPLLHHLALNPVRSLAMVVLIALVIGVAFIPMWMLLS